MPSAEPSRTETYRITDAELRLHYEFVHVYESLRKRHGHREMSDEALHDIASRTSLLFETLKIARHLRNAIAHDEPVNSSTVGTYLDKLSQQAPLASRPEDIGIPSAASTQRPSAAVGPGGGLAAYRILAWKDERLEQESIANGFVAISEDEIGDITDIDDPEQIRNLLTNAMPDRSPGAISVFVGYWRRFKGAALGDLVVLPTRDRAIAIGEFVGPHIYVATATPRARHRRAVSWLAEGLDRQAFGGDLLSEIVRSHHTVQTIHAADGPLRLLSLANIGVDPGPRDESGF